MTRSQAKPETRRSHGEPLFRIAKRDALPVRTKILIRAAAILLALLIDALFIVLVTKLNPIAVYARIFAASFSANMLFMQLLRDLTSLCASAWPWRRPSGCASGTSARRGRCSWADSPRPSA